MFFINVQAIAPAGFVLEAGLLNLFRLTFFQGGFILVSIYYNFSFKSITSQKSLLNANFFYLGSIFYVYS